MSQEVACHALARYMGQLGRKRRAKPPVDLPQYLQRYENQDGPPEGAQEAGDGPRGARPAKGTRDKSPGESRQDRRAEVG